MIVGEGGLVWAVIGEGGLVCLIVGEGGLVWAVIGEGGLVCLIVGEGGLVWVVIVGVGGLIGGALNVGVRIEEEGLFGDGVVELVLRTR